MKHQIQGKFVNVTLIKLKLKLLIFLTNKHISLGDPWPIDYINNNYQIFQTMNSGRLFKLSLKYQRFIPQGCKDLVIGKFEFVGKTQFLQNKITIQKLPLK